MKKRDPIIQAILENNLTAAQLRAHNRLCKERERLINRVMTSGRWQAVLVKSLLLLLNNQAGSNRDQIKKLTEMLEWIDSTFDYFAETSARIMTAGSRGEVMNITWNWDQFLKTYPGHMLWDLTTPYVDNYLLPATGISE